VIIEATIGASGSDHRRETVAIDRHARCAALDAVRQWAFMPTPLDGTPVPVMMTVTVNYSLR